MPGLDQIRQQYPQYNDMSDQQLSDAFYNKYYSDMPRADFDRKMGIANNAARPSDSNQSAGSGDQLYDHSEIFKGGSVDWNKLGHNAVKTLVKDPIEGIAHLGDLARNPNKIKPSDVPDLILPMIGGEAGIAKGSVESQALDRMGASRAAIKSAKAPDAMQDLLKNAVTGAKQGITGATGAVPAASERTLAGDVGQGLGAQFKAAKSAETDAHELAKQIGETVDVRGVSNIDDVRRIVGQYGADLKKQGQGMAQALRGEKLKGDREILDLKEEIHNLQSQDLAGEDLSDIDRARMDLRAKRLENAQSQLAHKTEINENLDKQISEAEATEKQYSKGGLPKEINSARDLIELKQFLNSVEPSKLSAVEVAQLKQQKQMVDTALKEAGEVGTDISKAGKLPLDPNGPPAFGDALSKANKTTEINAERYGGDAAKDLGVDKALLAATKKTGRAGVDQHALSNIISSASNFTDRIKNTGHVDWLRDNLPKGDFDKLMATKLNDMLDKVGTDGSALRENREMIDHILKDAVGVKGGKLEQQLNDLQTVLDKFSPQQAGISLEMAPKTYRGKDPAVARAVNAVKAGFSAVASKGTATAYSISKGAEALSGGYTGEARRLKTLRKELLNVKKPPKNITGPALGAYLSGDQQ